MASKYVKVFEAEFWLTVKVMMLSFEANGIGTGTNDFLN